MRDKRINGNFQLAFPACTRLFRLVLRIALSLAAPAGDNDGQAVFPAQPVADVAYAVIAPLVGAVFAVVDEIDRTKNHMVMVFFMQLALSFDKLLEIENPVDASRASGYSSE